MPKRVLDLYQYINPDEFARQICDMYDKWVIARAQKEKDWAELRNYVFATDTSTTSNSSLPWKNKTTRPKICQIRDNLHANYMAALFPNEDWFTWMAADKQSATYEKSRAIITYMKNKLNLSKFRQEISKLVFDFIDYGNCFADVEFLNERHELSDGQVVQNYVGPVLRRISPYDIVFDITSSSFKNSPKIERMLLSMGDIQKMISTMPEWAEGLENAFSKVVDVRAHYKAFRAGDVRKSEGFKADGFGSLQDYYNSGYIELLQFEGDIYDVHARKMYENYHIAILDRAYIVYMGPINNWFGRSLKEHSGWRLRPDNLWAMGPLDNLVGMQYRIDHLENLKADVFDQIAHPALKIRGYVEDFDWQPGTRIYMGEEGDVSMLVPDTTALNADFQIATIENEMEEMAGAPKQAMGFRTPGEKTAYEVQTLENAAGRIFQSKISYFEENFLEPLLNNMLECAKRNLDGADVVRALDTDIGIQQFLSITQEDLTAKGKLVPRGARHFAAKATLVQNLTNLANSAIYADPSVKVHMSGKQIAKLIVENLGLEGQGVFGDNIALDEQLETQRLSMAAQEQLQVEGMTPVVPTGEEGMA
jgi:hypothetical protein